APPQPKLLVKQGDSSVKDAQVCALNSIPSQALVVDPKGGVKNALVYIPRPTAVNPEAVSAAKQTAITFDQKQCVFEPHVLAVLRGAPVHIKSSDQVQHNVHLKLVNTNFNQALQPGQAVDVQTQKEPSPGRVVCDIHPWMSAWWLVSESPYFAVTK